MRSNHRGRWAETGANRDRIYSGEEIEFMLHIDRCKRRDNKPFLNCPADWVVLLGWIAELGYRRDGADGDEAACFVAHITRRKRLERKPFPSWSDVLRWIKELGYRRDAVGIFGRPL